jgi:import inner membrane translocase subunit TIM54
MDPAGMAAKELEGGTVLVGRLSLKEYMEGLKRGWMGRVDEWSLEGDVRKKVEGDGVFEPKKMEVGGSDSDSDSALSSPQQLEAVAAAAAPEAAPPAPAHKASAFSFLSRPTSPTPQANIDPNSPTATATVAAPIPEHYHQPPNPLPALPPITLLPFTNHMGFKQFPHMIYDFFTERYRVRQGADAALALIGGQTRPFEGPDANGSANISSTGSETHSTPPSVSSELTASDSTPNDEVELDVNRKQGGDLDFNLASEPYIYKSFFKFPNTIAQTRKDYYTALEPRIENARAYEEGTRSLTEAEQSGTKKIESIEDLKAERILKEMRWQGGEDGYEIVKRGKGVVWDPRWEGWLKVFVNPGEKFGGAEGSTKFA